MRHNDLLLFKGSLVLPEQHHGDDRSTYECCDGVDWQGSLEAWEPGDKIAE